MLLCAYHSAKKRSAYQRENARLKRNAIAECYKCASQAHQDKSKIVNRERTKQILHIQRKKNGQYTTPTELSSAAEQWRHQEFARFGLTSCAPDTTCSNIVMHRKIWIDKIISSNKGERDKIFPGKWIEKDLHGQRSRKSTRTTTKTNNTWQPTPSMHTLSSLHPIIYNGSISCFIESSMFVNIAAAVANHHWNKRTRAKIPCFSRVQIRNAQNSTIPQTMYI